MHVDVRACYLNNLSQKHQARLMLSDQSPAHHLAVMESLGHKPPVEQATRIQELVHLTMRHRDMRHQMSSHHLVLN